MAHMDFTATSFLNLSQAHYQSRLNKEMQVQHYKQACQMSYHKVLRVQSTLIDTGFIHANHSDVMFAAIISKKITLKEVKTYIKKYNELKQRVYKTGNS
jgi:malate/lactate dehydrogenase